MAERNWDDTGLTTSDTISTTEWEDMTQNNIIPSETHITSNGSDHSYINQDVSTTASPEFSEVVAYNFTHKKALTAGEALVAGDLVYLKSDGKYWKVNAAATTTTAGKLAILLTSSLSADALGTFIVQGNVTTTGLTSGATYFVSTTAGEYTSTVPSTTGQFVRAIGVATSTTNLEFIPSLDVYEVA